jgi:small-conductance mechanosensitive channel
MTLETAQPGRRPGTAWHVCLTGLAAMLMTLVSPCAARAEPHEAPQAPVRATAIEPVMLRLFNRDIAELRGVLGGFGPEQRATRAQRSFAALPDTGQAPVVAVQPMSLTEGSGYTFQVDGQTVFTLMAADLDLEERLSLKESAERTQLRLEDAVVARTAQRTPKVWLQGLAIVLISLLLCALGLRLLMRLQDILKRRADAAAEGTGPASYVLVFSLRLLSIGVWLLLAGLVYAQAVVLLDAFPWSAPWGDALARFVLELAGALVTGLIGSVPGLLTIAAVLLLARLVQDVLRMFLDRVQSGSVRVPFLHAETVGATRRLLNLLVWGIAVAVAYPYMPGSNSDAFKGVSVFFGVMITLGSTGLVNQLMSGLVVVYSRSLKKDDFIAVNGVEGVVTEVGALSVKILNLRNEEVTMPNSVITSNPIHNYSKLSGQQGTLISTKVTIGYDAPWRQVHALLIHAASKTAGVRMQPEPFVYQRALSDFYVEYELFAHIDTPVHRVAILSAMHGAIQDEFNACGVQIMSPHFFDQPAQAIVVPRDKWHEAPVPQHGPGTL